MAHYALLDENNVVVQVITGVDENVTQTDLDGTQVGGSSEAWENFYASLPWFEGLVCKRTSFNNNIRKRYAMVGGIYDPIEDIFISPQPFPSWSLDENTDWQPPTPMPLDELPESQRYVWDESNLEWVVFP